MQNMYVLYPLAKLRQGIKSQNLQLWMTWFHFQSGSKALGILHRLSVASHQCTGLHLYS